MNHKSIIPIINLLAYRYLLYLYIEAKTEEKATLKVSG